MSPRGGPPVTSAHFKGRVLSAAGTGGHWLVVVPHLDLVVVHRVDTDTPGLEVTTSQFGRLMQLIMDAKEPARSSIKASGSVVGSHGDRTVPHPGRRPGYGLDRIFGRYERRRWGRPIKLTLNRIDPYSNLKGPLAHSY